MLNVSVCSLKRSEEWLPLELVRNGTKVVETFSSPTDSHVKHSLTSLQMRAQRESCHIGATHASSVQLPAEARTRQATDAHNTQHRSGYEHDSTTNKRAHRAAEQKLMQRRPRTPPLRSCSAQQTFNNSHAQGTAQTDSNDNEQTNSTAHQTFRRLRDLRELQSSPSKIPIVLAVESPSRAQHTTPGSGQQNKVDKAYRTEFRDQTDSFWPR